MRILSLALLSVLTAVHCFSAAASERPLNVLFLLADDLRVEVGAYGDTAALTPSLDKLAASSVRFERAYCQYPLCAPSRTSMLTGRHPTRTQVYGNREWVGYRHPSWVSLPAFFQSRGYTTVRSGKVFHGGLDDTAAWTRGGESRQYGQDVPPANPPGPYLPQRVSKNEVRAHTQQMVSFDRSRSAESDRWAAVAETEEAQLDDTRVANVAIAELQALAQQGRPFFLACGFSKPHSPLVAPQRFFDLYDGVPIDLPVDFAVRPTVPAGFPEGAIRPNNADLFVRRDASPEEARAMIKAYLACVSYMDWNVGRVLDALSACGLQENTLVVFWSDHGYQLGEKGKWSKAGSLWEKGTRVPFLIYDPRRAPAGGVCTRIVQAVDIYPTIVDLAGWEVPADLDGRSLRPLVSEPTAPWPYPAFTVWNERNKGITGAVIRTERWRYAEFFGALPGRMLTDPLADVAETKNLANDPAYAEVVAALSRQVQEYVAGQTEIGE